MPAPSSSPREKLVGALLAVFAAAVFANSVANDFVLDDRTILLDNPKLGSLASIPALFAMDYWQPYAKGGLYRPLVTTSYALNRRAGGEDPRGYHAVNVGLHALATLLVWMLFRRLPVAPAVAWGGALLFAAHAVHAEAVANVVGRAELLCAVFFLAALVAHADAAAAPERRRRLRIGSVALYALALLSKENAVTLPAVLLLHDLVYAPLRERRFAPRLRRLLDGRGALVYAPYLVATAAYLAARHFALAGGGPTDSIDPIDNPLVSQGLPLRMLNALALGWRYVGRLVWPLHLSYDYSYDQIELLRSFAEPRAIAVLAASLGALALWALCWRRWRDLFYAIGFAAIAFSVTSNLIVSIGTLFAERLLYLPSVGFCLAVALALERACRWLPGPRAAHAAFAGLVAAAVGLHAARAVVRSADWRSEYQLFLHDLDASPRSAKVQGNAGAVLLERGRFEEAAAHLRLATEIAPGRASGYARLGELFTLPRPQWENVKGTTGQEAMPRASRRGVGQTSKA